MGTTSSQPRDIAATYARRGWSPIPVPFKTKKPVLTGWSGLRLTEADLPSYFNGQAQNVGIILGAASGGLTDVDLDSPEAVAVAPYLLPPTEAVFGRKSRRCSHMLYVTDLCKTAEAATVDYDDPAVAKGQDEKARLVELRTSSVPKGTGAQTVFPGSVHVSGEDITWDRDGEPARVDGAKLAEAVRNVAVAALVARYWPAEGCRHDAALALGGFLARAGFDTPHIALIAEAVARAAGDEEWRNRKQAARDAADAFRSGKKSYGLRKLGEVLQRPVAGRAAEWLGYGGRVEEEQEGSERAEAAPDPSAPVFDPWDSYIVPPFPLEIFSDGLCRFVETQSKVIGCDPTAVAMSALATLSGALDHRFALRMLRNGDWYASPRLWVLLVGDPSRKKTPAITATTRVLERQEQTLWDAWEQECAEAKKLDENAELPPKPPRFVVKDVTPEKLGEMLARHDRGTLIKREELAGWIGSMERYNRGAKGASTDRAFWLEAFDGGPHTVDRISRGELRIKNLSVSIIGGIQPDRLAELHGLTSDGLLQRFLPVMIGPASFPDDIATVTAAEWFKRLVRGLVAALPARVIMTDAAYDVATALRRRLHDLEQVGGGLAQGFQGWVGKLAGMFGSVALILHMVRNSDHGNAMPVEAGTVEAAARFITDFALPHAFEFYRSAETVTDGDRLQKVASWILTARKPRIVCSDLTTNVAHFRGLGVWDVNQRLSPLVAGGWLTACEQGPVSRSWNVNPAVYEQMAQRAQAEERRKQALAEMMNGPRKKGGDRVAA